MNEEELQETVKNCDEDDRIYGDDAVFAYHLNMNRLLVVEIRRLNAMIEKVRALHPAQFTRADVMKILKEWDS